MNTSPAATLVDAELDRLVPPETAPPETIHRAMRYSLFAGGKRIRPILCIEAARAVSRFAGWRDGGRLLAGTHPHLLADPRRSAGAR